MKDIFYIVEMKEEFFWDGGLALTTIKKRFCGRLVNQTGVNFYFELNGSEALVIVPHEGIEWMAPSKALWDTKKINGGELRITNRNFSWNDFKKDKYVVKCENYKSDIGGMGTTSC